MKNFKLKLFLMMLVSCHVVTPVSWTEQKQNASIFISLAAAYYTYNLIPYYVDQPAEFYVKHSYPHAQLWYEEMIVKYPQAHLDKKNFLQMRYGIPREEISWSLLCKNIYASQVDLIYLESVYSKKIDAQELSSQELDFLDLIEWLLLHEAGHVELNYSLHAAVFTLGCFTTLEIIKMVYKESTDDACKKSIESIVATCFADDVIKNYFVSAAMWMRYGVMNCLQGLSLGVLTTLWVRDQEMQADNFANQHATADCLPIAIRFFEYFINEYQPSIDLIIKEIEEDADFVSLLSYFNITVVDFVQSVSYFGIDPIHPSFDYRIQSIRDEIERRLEKNNQA